jgi:hypothetical protein
VSITSTACGAGKTGLVKRRELIGALTWCVADITGLSEAEVAAQGVVDDILEHVKTQAELEAYLSKLAQQYNPSA